MHAYKGQKMMGVTKRSACRACCSEGQLLCARAVLSGGTLAPPQAGKQTKIVAYRGTFLFHTNISEIPFQPQKICLLKIITCFQTLLYSAS